MATRTKPLLGGDPAEVAGYRILGRIGEGGQGVVYLGEGPGGMRVAVKMLRYGPGLGEEGSLGDFRREIELTRRVKAFCTAGVLETGELNGLPYIVSEYVDGPSLSEVISERGRLRGAELRRLALGTLTALAAIHQAGVVHRDFKPGNVLLSRDGPRVIDFGIARGLDVSELTGEHIVGTPPYMAPEQFTIGGSGAPADMFSWASTIVAAATGRPPFGSGDLPVVINRILSAEPDLGAPDGGLDGDLRELVARCLAKNPGERPTASQALLTLLGHPVPQQDLLAAGEAVATPPSPAPPRPRRRRAYVAAAAALALVAAGGGVAYHLSGSTAGPPSSSAPPAPRPTPSSGPMAATSTVTSPIPDTGIVLHENPADPVWASSLYGAGDDTFTGAPSYVRDPKTGEFAFFGTYQFPIVSPGGAYVAALPTTNFTRTDYSRLRIVDRARGEEVQLRVDDKPGNAADMRWHTDQRLLLTVYRDNVTTGFVVVDPAARSVVVRNVPGAGTAAYAWGPDGTVMHQTADGAVRFRRLDGTEVRSFRNVGDLSPAGVTSVADHGEVFTTECPAPDIGLCLWDAATGARRATVPLPTRSRFNGWLDDRHYMATMTGAKTTKVVLVDLEGTAVRTLAEGPAKEMAKSTLWFTAK